MAVERKTIFTVHEASPLRGEDLFFVGQIRNGKPSTNRVSLHQRLTLAVVNFTTSWLQPV